MFSVNNFFFPEIENKQKKIHFFREHEKKNIPQIDIVGPESIWILIG